jgi:hypothetical protein
MYARSERARGAGDAGQWIFQLRLVFWFAHRRFRPSALPSSLAEIPLAELNSASMCGMFVYAPL